ncbi:MAG: N-acetylmuramoyl-L-alanine amidase [Bdellovibrionales bacterium]|nr:N-acetylmuramoyl-L-alanine amidase [Bdellovibrionales bacterium]
MGENYRQYVMLLTSLFLSLTFGFQVIIDPGHGGVDTGAAYYGANESEITLSVSRLLAKKLQDTRGINVSLSRTKDVSLDLSDRPKFAHKQKGDFFVSIHTNSSPEKRATGLEIYIENILPADQDSLFLAYRENQIHAGAAKPEGRPSQYREKYSAEVSTILDDIAKSHYLFSSIEAAQVLKSKWLEDRGGKARIRQAPFRVISTVNMPSILVEIGFLSNRKEAEILKNPREQEKIAETLYRSIIKYKESVDKRKI